MFLQLLIALAIVGITFLLLKKYEKKEYHKQTEDKDQQAQATVQSQSEIKKSISKKNSSDIQQQAPQQIEKSNIQTQPLPEQQSQEKKSSEQIKESKKKHHLEISHPLLLTQLKGFSQVITDYFVADNYIAVASKDKTFKIFDLIQTIKDKQPKYYYYQNQYNTPTAIAISENYQYVAQALSQDLSIQILTFDPTSSDNKKYFTVYSTFKNNIHTEEIMKVSFSKNNQLLVSVAQQTDMNIKVWTLQGVLIKQLNTNCIQHNDAAISNHFIAVANWTSVVKVLEIKLNKDNTFNSLEKVMNLSEQTKVNSVSISSNDKVATTISQDNTITFWNIDVRYMVNEDAKILFSIKFGDYKKFFKQEQFPATSACAVYHEIKKKWLYAITNSQEIAIIDENVKLVELLEDVVSKDCQINRIQFLNIKDNVVLLSLTKAEFRVSVFKMNKFFQ